MNFSQSELTCDTSIVPTTTPGSNAMTIGSVRRQTCWIEPRFTHNTYALSTTSIGTSAGFSTRFVRKNSATGTVMEEKPYPSAPLTVAARSVMAASAIVVGSMRQRTSRGPQTSSFTAMNLVSSRTPPCRCEPLST